MFLLLWCLYTTEGVGFLPDKQTGKLSWTPRSKVFSDTIFFKAI